MMNFLNPELLSISKSKEMGIWSPGGLSSFGVLPYIKRLPKPKINILDVGAEKGENAFFLLDSDKNDKIEMVYGVQIVGDADYSGLLHENLKDFSSKFKVVDQDFQKTGFDVVCVNTSGKSAFDLDMMFNLYYDYTKSGGIFCGNNHATPVVKEALGRLRRAKRIGQPINVSFDNFFWYIR